MDPTSVGEENKTFFVKMWKLFSSKSVLKTLRISSGLSGYKWYQSQTSRDV